MPRERQSSLAGRVRSLATGSSKAQITIDLNGQSCPSQVLSFSTNDKIEGNVSIVAPQDTPFDHLEIALIGHCKTYVDRVSTAPINNRYQQSQQFLKLEQPMDESDLPEVLKAGQEQVFPFTFVVPDQLLPAECRHKLHNHTTRQAHLKLPPTFGDSEIGEDDATPTMTKVFYRIRVSLKRQRAVDRPDLMTIADKTRRIKLIPAFEEQPPLTYNDKDGYCPRAEKSVKKGMFMTKTGRITMETRQPRSLDLPPPDSTDPAKGRLTTTAAVMFRFDPYEASAQAPNLKELSSKLRILTHFSAHPYEDFPPNALYSQDLTRGVYHESVHLSTRGLSGSSDVKWVKHEAGSCAHDVTFHRGSLADPTSTFSYPEKPQKAKSHMPFYTAQLHLPITLPSDKKAFVPTFHHCMMSRLYILEMTLSYNTSNNPNSSGGVGTPTLTLKVPLQISSRTDATGEALAHQVSQRMAVGSRHPSNASADDGIDDFFTPRNVAPPDDELHRRGSGEQRASPANEGSAARPAAPPEYSLHPRAGGVRFGQAEPWQGSVPGKLLRQRAGTISPPLPPDTLVTRSVAAENNENLPPALLEEEDTPKEEGGAGEVLPPLPDSPAPRSSVSSDSTVHNESHGRVAIREPPPYGWYRPRPTNQAQQRSRIQVIRQPGKCIVDGACDEPDEALEGVADEVPECWMEQPNEVFEGVPDEDELSQGSPVEVPENWEDELDDSDEGKEERSPDSSVPADPDGMLNDVTTNSSRSDKTDVKGSALSSDGTGDDKENRENAPPSYSVNDEDEVKSAAPPYEEVDDGNVRGPAPPYNDDDADRARSSAGMGYVAGNERCRVREVSMEGQMDGVSDALW